MAAPAPDPAPVNAALRRLHRSAIVSLALCAVAITGASGCVGMAIGAATDAAIEVGKVPFKVGGAVVDVVSDDDKQDEKKKKGGDQD